MKDASADLPDHVVPEPQRVKACESVAEYAQRKGVSVGEAAGAVEAARAGRARLAKPHEWRSEWRVYINARHQPQAVYAGSEAKAVRLARRVFNAKRSDIVQVVEIKA